MGVINRENLLQDPYNSWFTPNYKGYVTDKEVMAQLSPLLQDITLKVFLGTWCGDSQDQIPLLYKILDEANFNTEHLEVISVNRSMSTPDDLQKGFNIERVPTIIVYKNGKEMGRFVEYPRKSVEADLLKIASGQDYKHVYEK
ncbi:MAG: thioredoxin family protein [Flavobacteriaceae bacterium]|nr:thioredoxin family protein [Flavobacteriaceae bacterium]